MVFTYKVCKDVNSYIGILNGNVCMFYNIEVFGITCRFILLCLIWYVIYSGSRYIVERVKAIIRTNDMKRK